MVGLLFYVRLSEKSKDARAPATPSSLIVYFTRASVRATCKFSQTNSTWIYLLVIQYLIYSTVNKFPIVSEQFQESRALPTPDSIIVSFACASGRAKF